MLPWQPDMLSHRTRGDIREMDLTLTFAILLVSNEYCNFLKMYLIWRHGKFEITRVVKV